MSKKLFSILPMTQRFSLQPGHTYTGSLTIAVPNDATEDFSYQVTVVPYSVHGEEYHADISSTNPRTEIANWITIDNPTGVISPNHTADVNYTLTVPADTPPGGQYAALLDSSRDEPLDQESTVSNLFQLSSIIYADVAGEVIRGGSVLTNDIPGFSLESRITTSTTVENTGNTHRDAIISLRVTNALTGETIFPATDDDPDHFTEIIMPETTRYLTKDIDHLPLVGVVKVNQTVYFNDVSFPLEKDVIICPLWFIFLVVFLVSFIIATIVLSIRRHRRKKSTVL